jgi:hypothetical protein
MRRIATDSHGRDRGIRFCCDSANLVDAEVSAERLELDADEHRLGLQDQAELALHAALDVAGELGDLLGRRRPAIRQGEGVLRGEAGTRARRWNPLRSPECSMSQAALTFTSGCAETGGGTYPS